MLSVSAFGWADNTSSHASLPTLIIPDITKTSSNNWLLLDEAEYDIQNYTDQRDLSFIQNNLCLPQPMLSSRLHLSAPRQIQD